VVNVEITKKDVIWSYAATFFSIGTGFITLPLILNKLSVDEVGMNYLMLTVGAFVSLLECSFAGQIGRNITYVFSGAQKIYKEGLEPVEKDKEINYHLLATLIKTAQFIYLRISLLVLFILCTFGTMYMYHVTNGFTNVHNSLLIWLIYSISVSFNIYYLYYNSLLTGAALIMQSKKAMVYSKILQIVLCYVMLFYGYGLISVVIANLLSPFVSRIYSYVAFYTEELKPKLGTQIVERKDVHEAFDVMWYTTKRLAINMVGSYFCVQSGMFMAGLFLTLAEVASYGLMVQLCSVLAGVASTMVQVNQTAFYKLRIQGDEKKLLCLFSFSMMSMYLIIVFGGIFIIFAGNFCLELIHSKSMLPSMIIMSVYIFNLLLSYNHAFCAVFIVSKNEVPFVKASVFAGFAISLLTLALLYFTNWGLVALVLPSLIVHSLYNHWRWHKWVLNDLEVSFSQFLCIGIHEIKSRLLF